MHFENKEYQADKINHSEPKKVVLSLHILQEEIQSSELRLQEQQKKTNCVTLQQ